MKWKQNLDGAFVLRDEKGTFLGGCWISGGKWRASAVVDDVLYKNKLLGKYKTLKDAKEAVLEVIGEEV